MIRLTPTREEITVEYDVDTDNAIDNQRPGRPADRVSFKPTSAAVTYTRCPGFYEVEFTGPCANGGAGFARYTGLVARRPTEPLVLAVLGRLLHDTYGEKLP